jgi:hypothetical protein
MEEVVYLKVSDGEKGDIVYQGKVSKYVKPDELMHLGSFWERALNGIYNKVTNEEVKSLKGLQNNVELISITETGVFLKRFSGVLYIGAADGVLRKRKSVPLCDCVMMSVWKLPHEECEKAFKCATLVQLVMCFCELNQIPREIETMKKLTKLTLCRLEQLKRIPEEIGELSNLEELRIEWNEIEILPKRLKYLKMLRLISLWGLTELQLNTEDLDVFSKLRHLTIWECCRAFSSSAQAFWKMIKSTTNLSVLELDWWKHDEKMIFPALGENGSIVDGGYRSESYAQFFERNNKNHQRTIECVVHLLTIRRRRSAYNYVPKEIFLILGRLLWNTKCDLVSWNI